jgi:hypothetical protein
MFGLQVGDQPGDILVIGGRNKAALAQIPLALASLAGEDVAGECAAALDLPGTRLFEPLGSTTVCLDLRHVYIPLL